MSLKGRLLTVAVLAMAGGMATLRADSPIRYRSLQRNRPAGAPYRPGEVVVQFKADSDARDVERAIGQAGGARARRSFYGQRYLVTLESDVSVPQAVARFRAMPEVEIAEPNHLMHAFFTPNDRLSNGRYWYEYQWNFKQIGAERMWDIQKGDPSVVVAVLDTGIAYEDYGPFRKAPDWGDTVFVKGFNTFDLSEHANDDNAHGTHVASTIAEGTDNNLGVAGLAFKCALMPVKVLDSEGSGDEFNLLDGLDYAINFTKDGQKPVKVINLSLGFPPEVTADDVQIVKSAVARAVSAGIVVVAAAGNESVGTVDVPAALPNVIAVGAGDGRKHLAPYSNFGPRLDVVAPGGDFDRDDDGDGYPDGILQQTFDPDTVFKEGRYDDFHLFFFEGTSQATPHVAALAALLVRQGITDPMAVRAAIQSTAEDLGSPGRDDTFGYGLIRPEKALSGLGLGQ